ncbi:hypothetical protein [Myroides odoratus]|uniref:J domain-containing protein n=1 Tax=Myroides odoratus TaxID=256 RepID=A0A9Q6Z2P9_MYROD|nr:hypothetical protein [Myroides odoratus]EHQ41571.1 hypothetical protein Myrod_0735 [Myroides odoratus DSM 2801]EKB02732.1 hypothetical protein HMPREF9716_03665 [Myroides odoratus CIP 103059]QQT98987.1 hypothetical protein I6I88_12285 [Myroides odoratus]WQD58823.1 hypothetical protein U0010_06685 [Myroides odoratus]STZ28835.1 Uncharacterised protein [Myroides odoratus]
MDTNYFTNCKTLDEAKNLFKKLCFELHPDTSGYNSQSEFIQMFKEFKSLENRFNTSNTEENKNNSFNAEQFYNIVKMFEGLEGINISFVGSFIWLTDLTPGAMYSQKERIKTIAIDNYNAPRWAGQKKSWYFSPSDYVKKGRSNKDLSELKDLFGSTDFQTKSNLKLAM